MATRHWTLMVVPDDGAPMRRVRLERGRLRRAAALLLVAGVATLAAAAAVGGTAGRADARLVEKNEVLTRALEDLALRVDTLEGSLDRLAAADRHYRLLAGLEPLDPGVLLAGIGGPDGDTLGASELYRVDPTTGRLAFDASLQVAALIRRASVLVYSWGEARERLSSEHARLGATPSIQPTAGRRSSAFTQSRWHPLLNRPRPHLGIDIVAPIGEPVIASANGRVTHAERRGDYGLLVEIDHGHGVVTRYAHLSRSAVRPGQAVQRGERIGAVGNSGLSAGPHLHYEVLVDGRHADPSRYILDGDAVPD